MGFTAVAGRLGVALTALLVLGSAVSPASGQTFAYVPTADRASVDAFNPHSVTRTVSTSHMTRVTKLRAEVARIAQAKRDRTAVLKVAQAQIGDPYIAGRAGPDSFDCGGLVQFVFEKALGMELNRTSYQQYAQAKKIKRKHAQPGDLVFFFEGGAHHVGIYIGNGKMIDAPKPGEDVRVSPITGFWWGRSYTGMGRILPAV